MLPKYIDENGDWVDRVSKKVYPTYPEGPPETRIRFTAPGKSLIGVMFNPFTKKYQSLIYMNGRWTHINYYATAEEAAQKHDIVAALLKQPLNYWGVRE